MSAANNLDCFLNSPETETTFTLMGFTSPEDIAGVRPLHGWVTSTLFYYRQHGLAIITQSSFPRFSIFLAHSKVLCVIPLFHLLTL